MEKEKKEKTRTSFSECHSFDKLYIKLLYSLVTIKPTMGSNKCNLILVNRLSQDKLDNIWIDYYQDKKGKYISPYITN